MAQRAPLTRAQERAVARVADACNTLEKARAQRDKAVRAAVALGIPPSRLAAELPPGSGLGRTRATEIAGRQ